MVVSQYLSQESAHYTYLFFNLIYHQNRVCVEWGGETRQLPCKKSYKQKIKNVLFWEEKSNAELQVNRKSD